MIETHPTHTAIIRDGLAVDVVHNADVLGWFLRHHSFSMSHALEHEGFALETRAVSVRGWMDYRQNVERRGYGVPGALSRLAAALQDTIEAYGQDTARAHDSLYPTPAEFDGFAGPILARMIGEYVDLMSHTGRDTRAAHGFDSIRGELASWGAGAAARMGETL